MANAIAAVGFEVVLMSDVFVNDGQDVSDPEWIALVSERDWIALTKDAAIARAHTAELLASTVRIFALPNSNLTGPEMARRFSVNINRIVQRARKPGPFIDIVHANRIERRWPPT